MIAALACSPVLADPPPVVVDGGSLQGISRDGLDLWLGIPYAEPPVGDLRWRAPQPVRPWDGTRNADAFGPSCLQPDVTPVSEDCLTVNVYRPAGATGKLPVMVWIHGGAMVRGGSSIYPLQAIAAQGVVAVSLNYRLGRLGFFAHPALTEAGVPRGNYGFLDQIAALRWVQQNIAAFGGDPARVTLFGESAGGGSVLVHLVSPLSRGLFAQAILQSPGTPGGRASEIPMSPLPEAERIAQDYAATFGINGAGADAATALRALPGDRLIAGATGEEVLAALAQGTIVPGMAMAIIDGTLMPETPEAALAAGHQARLPVMIGGNNRDLGLGTAASREDLFALFGPDAAKAASLYDPQGTTGLDELKLQVFMDMTMLEPARHLADELARAGQPVWLYRFSYVPEAHRATMPGTMHGMEIPFVLNLPQVLAGDATTAADRAMARTVSAYWVGFAKAGNPNGPGRPDWPGHDPASPRLVNFTNEGVVIAADPLSPRLDLWAARHADN